MTQKVTGLAMETLLQSRQTDNHSEETDYRGRRPTHQFSRPPAARPTTSYQTAPQHHVEKNSGPLKSHHYITSTSQNHQQKRPNTAFNTSKRAMQADPDVSPDGHFVEEFVHMEEDLDMNTLQNGFTFRRRLGKLDWRMLAGIDVNRVIRDVDVQTLQDVLENITFAAVDGEDLSYYPETNFVKVFSLAQLIIEYMLHSQAYLASRRSAIERKTVLASSEAKRLMQDLQQATETMEALRKENRQLKKTVYAYQFMAKMPGGLTQNDTNYHVPLFSPFLALLNH